MTGVTLKRPFKEVFKSTFHNKLDLNEFLSLNIENEYEIIQLKRREVYSPSAKLKSIHRFLNKSVLSYARLCEDAVFSYRKGVSVRDAVEKHTESTYFYQTDIKNFFKSIDKASVEKFLKARLNDSPFSDLENYFDAIINVVVADNHLPAGFATSPMLSNICLSSFDEILLATCQEEKLVYTRYSDDIIISSATSHFFESIDDKTQELLHKYVNKNTNLHVDKTQRHKKGQQFKLLGFSLLPNNILTIPSQDKKVIESLLYLFLNDESRFENAVTKLLKPNKNELKDKSIYDFGIRSLSGKLIGINAIDRNYISKLKRKYGNTVIEMFIRKSVK